MTIVNNEEKILDVAVAILFNENGHILINERLGDDVHSGHWEFPGGKLEIGERPQQALFRECQEELGIDVKQCTPIITFTHAYPSKTVRLHVFSVDFYENDPQSLEGQTLRWVKKSELNAQNLLPADVAIVKALVIPDYCFITPEVRDDRSIATILMRVNVFFEKADELILVMRQHHLSREDYYNFVCEFLSAIGAKNYAHKKLLIQLNTDLETYRKIVDRYSTHLKIGLHLTAKRLTKFKPDNLENKSKILIGASVHTEDEIDLAVMNDLDYLILGMVNPSLTHPDRTALNWSGFQSLVKDKAMPIFAIGGLEQEDISTVKENGGRGVAGIRMYL